MTNAATDEVRGWRVLLQSIGGDRSQQLWLAAIADKAEAELAVRDNPGALAEATASSVEASPAELVGMGWGDVIQTVP